MDEAVLTYGTLFPVSSLPVWGLVIVLNSSITCVIEHGVANHRLRFLVAVSPRLHNSPHFY
jgi:hypothetical protein